MSAGAAQTARAGGGWTAGRVIALVLGSIFGLIGLAGVVGGGALVWAATTQRDSDGYFTTDTERFSVGSSAITSEDVDLQLGEDALRDVDLGDFLKVRIRVRPAGEGDELFVGIARSRDVAAYLEGVEHDRATELDDDPFRVEYVTQEGEGEPGVPVDEDIWVEQSSGPGRQTVTWEPENGTWNIVVMNADGSRAVDARVDIGARVDSLWWIIGGLLVVGVAILALAIFLIVRSTHPRHLSPTPTTGVPAAAVGAAGLATEAEPVVLAAHLDEPLSRWLWLVKWLLAIPHYIVLALLWVVAILLTIVAFFAILFTGRYPRALFDFNLGVLRWTWRVGFYSAGALGTDRYPPFTLEAAPEYPATLDIAYPAELSRGLVLVKWWLFAIPHYVIVGIIGSGWWWGNFAWWGEDRWSAGAWGTWGGGLLGILVLIAAVRMLFTSHYPRDMFGLIIGCNRWVYRVLAYALLMTDRYPPFRLDQETSSAASPVGST